MAHSARSLKDFKPETAPVPCDCCGSTSFLDFSDEMRHGLNLKTVLCARCGLAQTNPQPTPRCLAEFYDKYYHLFHGRHGVDDAYLAKSKRLAARRFETIIQRRDPQQPGTLLEVGPGAGQFLVNVREQTVWRGHGIEPGTSSYQWCRSLGLDVEHVGIEDFQPAEKFDVIVSFHVLEHVASPKAFLEKCRGLLAEGGLLYLEVPNLNHPRGPYRVFLQFPHLYSFTLTSLWSYLSTAGFFPVYVDDTAELTVISTPGSAPFAVGDAQRQLKALRRKDKLQNLARWLPRLPLVERVRGAIEAT